MRYAMAQLVEAMCYKAEGGGFEYRGGCHCNFSLTYIFRPHYDPESDSDSNRNENQEYFLKVKMVDAYG